MLKACLLEMTGHFLLTNLLLENMKRACRDSGIEGRIVNVSSAGHIMTYPEGICFDKVHDPSGYSVVSYTDFK
jgi:NAD(P)-dependent dehydrogenase (short-subunit alcohol dehydrogenase family)